ncbi:hypothetical protein [Kribbella hippodromi]|uniref:hypothetical protein n=1 Tax=Kribbella hippodromi TaxID=434347 RepID=UPI0031E47264
MLTDRSTHKRQRRPTALALILIALTATSCGTVAAQGQRPQSSGTSASSGPPSAKDGVLPDRTSAYNTITSPGTRWTSGRVTPTAG